MRRNAVFGGIIWTALAAASRLHLVHLAPIELLFLLAPLVIVPLGLELCARIIPEDKPRFPDRLARQLQFPAALFVLASLLISPGIAAAALALPWFGVGGMTGVQALKTFIPGEFRSLKPACVILSFFYLLVGCAWLLASRLGMTPMGFQEPIVLLTAVHFHFAGFAAPLLALAADSEIKFENPAARRIFSAVAAGVLAGPGLLAAGFVIGPRTKLAMALVVACSEVGLSLYFLAAIRNLRPRLAQALVTISALSVLFAMVLAATWAIGEFPLQPFVHLDQMARFHGTANGIGFILCGLLGWSLAANGAAPLKGGTQ